MKRFDEEFLISAWIISLAAGGGLVGGLFLIAAGAYSLVETLREMCNE